MEAIEVCHNVRHQHYQGELGVIAWDSGREPCLMFHTLSLSVPGPRRAPQLPQNQRRNFGKGSRVSAALAMVSESQSGWKPSTYGHFMEGMVSGDSDSDIFILPHF